MMRIDSNNQSIYPGIGFHNNGVRIPRAEEQVRVQEEQARPLQKKEQEVVTAAAETAPVQRGNQAPQEAAQLIRPFISSLPEFAGGDAVHTQDMAQAISDMQKDEVLREYQYFVGSANPTGAAASDIAFQDGDGLVRRIS